LIYCLFKVYFKNFFCQFFGYGNFIFSQALNLFNSKKTMPSKYYSISNMASLIPCFLSLLFVFVFASVFLFVFIFVLVRIFVLCYCFYILNVFVSFLILISESSFYSSPDYYLSYFTILPYYLPFILSYQYIFLYL